MSLYPIYIDSSVSGATLSIGTTNTSSVIIGPVSQNGTANISTVINGVRIDSHESNNNLFVSFGNTSYKVTSSEGNLCNVAVSNWAFKTNSMTGTHCTAVGHNSLTKNSTGNKNTAIGADTLANVTTGGFNTALGGRALNLTTNSSNVAIGYDALASSVTSAYPNVAVGTNALENYNQTAGGGNTALGYNALAGLTSGLGNVAIGYIAENNPNIGIKTSGNDNVVIGTDAGSVNNNRCIVLGHGAAATGNDQIILGKSGGAHTTYIQGSGGLNVNVSATIANTTINTVTDGKAGQIILNKTEYSNNTIAYDATNGVIDYVTTTDDQFGPTGNNSFAKAIMIKGSNLNFSRQVNAGQWNKTGNGGNVLIRAGGSFSMGNNGTAVQTLNGGNIYIDSGTAACGGPLGSEVIANPGSIYLRCGRKSSGTTYYSSAYDDKMTITPTDITTTVPMKIYEAVGTGTITGTVDSMSATAGSLIIQHNNSGGGSSIVFPSRTNSTDFGYIRYRDDQYNTVGAEVGRLEIGVENDSPTDHLILQKNGGYVGIGTTSPAYTLDVTGTARVTGATTLAALTASGATTLAALTASGATSLQNTTISGTLGVGTTSPAYTLDVTGTARVTGATTLAALTASGATSLAALTASGATSLAALTASGATSLAALTASGATSLQNTTISGTARVTGATTLAALTASGATSLQNTTISGTLGVGTTSPVRTFSVTGKVSIGDNSHDSGEYGTVNICSDSRSYPQLSLIRGGNTAWQLGTIGTNNNFNIFSTSNGVVLAQGSSTWSAYSDRNLKTNFEDIEEPIKKINKIKGLYYKFKTDTPEEMRRVGVIAQDVQYVLPEAITELYKNNEPFLGVKYTELIPLLIEGIKSQQIMIDLQQKENDELKSRLSAIEARLAAAGI